MHSINLIFFPFPNSLSCFLTFFLLFILSPFVFWHLSSFHCKIKKKWIQRNCNFIFKKICLAGKNEFFFFMLPTWLWQLIKIQCHVFSYLLVFMSCSNSFENKLIFSKWDTIYAKKRMTGNRVIECHSLCIHYVFLIQSNTIISTCFFFYWTSI
jgi:hypothetical protein